MRKKVTPAQRYWIARVAQRVKQQSPVYQRSLQRSRTKELRRVLDICRGFSLESYPDIIRANLSEDSYLLPLMVRMYTNIGKNTGNTALERFLGGRKSVDAWEERIYQWIEQNAGEKISTIEETMKNEIIKIIQEIIVEGETLSIEMQTKLLHKELSQRWGHINEWQARRIIQTEAMMASSVGQYEAMNSLEVDYNKQWTATFNNTREWHAAMDGVVVGRDEFFELPNGDLMLYPHDGMYGARAENLINCSCGTIDFPK